MPVTDPINPIAAHIGGGVVQVYVDPQDESLVAVAKYEVTCAMTIDGTYYAFSNRFFSGRDGYIYGFPVGKTVYLRIRAIGADGSLSDWVQVVLGTASKPTTVMQLTAISGSTIPEGAVFVSQKDSHRLYGFKAVSEITFP